jgi:hypothetical protein
MKNFRMVAFLLLGALIPPADELTLAARATACDLIQRLGLLFYILDGAASRDMAILNKLGLMLASILENLLHIDHVTAAKRNWGGGVGQ